MEWTVITYELNINKKIQFDFKSYQEANQYYKAEIQLSTEQHERYTGSTHIRLLKNGHQVKEIIISSYINKN